MAKDKDREVLKVENLSVYYGGIAAIKDVSIEVGEGEIITLVGANGAGKSTLLKAVLGLQPARKGNVFFMGRDITRESTDRIVASGIVYIPEGGGILPLMTIKENLLLGSLHNRGDVNKHLRQVFGRFSFLEARQNQMASTLSGGQRQILAIGRALMGSPKLLMMDEPSLGLAPIIITEVFNIIAELKNAGYTIIVSEQNAWKALQYSDRAYVFQVGRIVNQGNSKDLLNNPEVQRAYLGGI